jgi:hypothetical protein
MGMQHRAEASKRSVLTPQELKRSICVIFLALDGEISTMILPNWAEK